MASRLFATDPVRPTAVQPRSFKNRSSRLRRTGKLLTLEGGLMHAVAVRAIDAGAGGLAAVGLSSILHGQGTTTIARGMALCMAETLGQRVVLVDANLRSPSLRQVFALQTGPGLTDVLGGRAPLESALHAAASGPVSGGRLLVLPAGPTGAENPATLGGSAMRDLIAELHGYADILVFDTAPLRPYADTTLLSRHLDGMVVVLQAERAKLDESEEAVQALRDSGVCILGAVLNRRKSYIPWLLDRLL